MKVHFLEGNPKWIYPIQMFVNDQVRAGIRHVYKTHYGNEWWEARVFVNEPPYGDRMMCRSREEAEAWLIAVVRLSC